MNYQFAQVEDVLTFAQQFDESMNTASVTQNLSSGGDELLEIFHMYNAQDFYNSPTMLAYGTKCAATGTCGPRPFPRRK